MPVTVARGVSYCAGKPICNSAVTVFIFVARKKTAAQIICAAVFLIALSAGWCITWLLVLVLRQVLPVLLRQSCQLFHGAVLGGLVLGSVFGAGLGCISLGRGRCRRCSGCGGSAGLGEYWQGQSGQQSDCDDGFRVHGNSFKEWGTVMVFCRRLDSSLLAYDGTDYLLAAGVAAGVAAGFSAAPCPSFSWRFA